MSPYRKPPAQPDGRNDVSISPDGSLAASERQLIRTLCGLTDMALQVIRLKPPV